jgi:hypothetical protein
MVRGFVSPNPVVARLQCAVPLRVLERHSMMDYSTRVEQAEVASDCVDAKWACCWPSAQELCQLWLSKMRQYRRPAPQTIRAVCEYLPASSSTQISCSLNLRKKKKIDLYVSRSDLPEHLNAPSSRFQMESLYSYLSQPGPTCSTWIESATSFRQSLSNRSNRDSWVTESGLQVNLAVDNEKTTSSCTDENEQSRTMLKEYEYQVSMAVEWTCFRETVIVVVGRERALF